MGVIFLQFHTVEMFPNTLENWISSMAMGYVGIPIFLFVAFQNLVSLKVSGIVLTANGLTALVKWLTRDTSTAFLKRPTDAEGCNVRMTGRQGGQPGFPSGHMATTTAFWTCVWSLVPVQYRQTVLWTGVVLSALMMWSRMRKSCHTALQCIAGAFLGVLVAFVGMQFLM